MGRQSKSLPQNLESESRLPPNTASANQRKPLPRKPSRSESVTLNTPSNPNGTDSRPLSNLSTTKPNLPSNLNSPKRGSPRKLYQRSESLSNPDTSKRLLPRNLSPRNLSPRNLLPRNLLPRELPLRKLLLRDLSLRLPLRNLLFTNSKLG